MNLLARILSHGFAVAVVAFLIIGFMYRGELFPEWELPELLSLDKSQEAGREHTPADERADEPESAPDVAGSADIASETVLAEEAEEAVAARIAEPGRPGALAVESELPQEAVMTTDERVSPATEAAESMMESVDTAPIAEETLSASRRSVGREPATAPATPALPRTESREPAAETGETVVSPGIAGRADTPARPGTTDRQGDAAMHPPGPAGTVTAPARVPAVAEPWSPAMPPVPPQDREHAVDATGLQATTGTVAAASPYQLLAAARESFWLRDYSGAENQYRQLIEIEPDNPDGYGELGNMYFSQGKWEEAASAYYNAGARLVTAGKLTEANQLVEVIRGLNGTRADDLEQLITAAEAAP